MTPQTAQFAGQSRIHMGLAIKDLEKSVAFYRTLFGQEPSKTRPNYAKFEVAEPSVNLSLNEVGGPTGPNHPIAHFGIQVKSPEVVSAFARRLAEAGLATEIEEHVTCCYAVQDKVWATDPDGNKWEVYVVLDENGAHHHNSGACCPQPMVEVGDLRQAESTGEAKAAKPAGTGACC